MELKGEDMLNRSPVKLWAVALSIALLCAMGAYAQFQTGNIYGKVQAKDGSVLPGVTVTLTGMGAPQTTVTGPLGDFRFINLSPGTYSMVAELAGYGTATRSGIGVRVGANADVTMTLNPSVSESITVTAEAPLLDVRKAGDSINVSRVELEKIPTARDPWTVLQQAPGVQIDRLNVGGNQSGQQSYYLGKGADSGQNTWNMDGVNITDMAATGSTPLYFDFDSFEEMQITTGGSDPRIMTPGVQLNMVTKRGTNDIRGSGRYFYTPGSLQTSPTVPAEAVSYLAKANAINYVRDYGAELGGPIWRDHVWGWLADSENKISNQAASTPTAVGSFDNIILRDKNAKLNGQILPSNSAVGFYTWGDKVRNARSLSLTRPFEAADRQTGPTKVYKLEDTQIFGSSLYLTGMWSKVSGGFGLHPNGGIGLSAPEPFRDINNLWHGTYRRSFDTIRPQKQYRLDGSKFLDIGTMNHEFKFGFGYRSTPTTSVITFPGPVGGYVRERSAGYCAARGLPGEGCFTTILYRDYNAAYAEKYNDAYVGDTILLGNLTVQAGLRWDDQKTNNLPTAVGPNVLLGNPLTLPFCPATPCGSDTLTAQLPALSFAGDPKTLHWKSIEPRLGMTYSLGADKKTLLRAAYNRYANQVGSIVANVNPLGYSYFGFVGNDVNGDHIPQLSELKKIFTFYGLDPANPAAVGAAPKRVDYGMKSPTTDELLLGLERELVADFSVGVNLTYRRYRNLTELSAEKTQGAGDYYTTADYVQIGNAGGTLPNGQTFGPVPVYDLKPGVPTPTFYVYHTRPDYNETFSGVELTATKRLSNRWMLRGNFSWADWKQHAGPRSFDDPTRRLDVFYNCVGACSGLRLNGAGAGSGSFADVFPSAKWTSTITGLYQLPWDFSIGASLAARQGYPRVVIDEVTTSSTAGTPTFNGGTDVILNQPGSLRYTNVYELDLRAAKDFRFFNRVGVTLSADLFNVPNKRTILQRNNLPTFSDEQLAGSGNNITEIQSPRVWRFGARINF
jgi:carboxypeptidase family protein/TonB-dependent receptor-like protein